MKTAPGKTDRDNDSFSIISLTECQAALSERQFGKQTPDTYFVWSWRWRAQRLVLIPEHLGDVTDFFSGIFPSKMKFNQCPRLRWGRLWWLLCSLVRPKTQHLSFLFGADIVYISSNGELQLLTVTNERDFPPSVTWTEGESETTLLERLFMIYWFY